jgi:hypothetical protein
MRCAGWPHIVFFLVFATASQTHANQFAGGTGELHDPYQIATASQLISIGSDQNHLDKHFVLVNDIDLYPGLPGNWVFAQAVIASDTEELTPGFQGNSFTGQFDGSGFSINNLAISGDGYLGLFGKVSEKAQVYNLTVAQASVVGTGTFCGAISGDNRGRLDNCHSTGTMSGIGGIGGLLGSNFGNVSGCSHTGSTSGQNAIGGLVGDNRGHLTDCQSTGTVFGTYLGSGTGGLVGRNSDTMNHCASSTTVSGNSRAGGLVGDNTGSVTHCYYTGAVSGTDYVGGLAGWNGSRGDVGYCYSAGDISASEGVGGLIGRNERLSRITNCYSTAKTSGIRDVGGLVGSSGGEIAHCYSIGKVSGEVNTGGLLGAGFGVVETAITKGCFWDIEASGLTESAAGTGLSTESMQTLQPYLDAGWDFKGYVQNGLHDIWQMPDASGYPMLTVFNDAQDGLLRGNGTSDDPFLIASATELGAIYQNPDAAYILEANIDMSGTQWSTAVIPTFGGNFDGNGYAISHLTISGHNTLGLFGELGPGAEIHDLGVVDVNISGTGSSVGGLVGSVQGSKVRQCYSTGYVSGNIQVGGLVGYNGDGSVLECYSTVTVSGDSSLGGLIGENTGQIQACYTAGIIEGSFCGGLVGYNKGPVSRCYSTSFVEGTNHLGGLVGQGSQNVTESFWNTETSGQTESAGGIGLTTVQMNQKANYLEAGWSFTYHPIGNPEAVWWMPEQDSPRLWWQYGYAYCPSPVDHAVMVTLTPLLQWSSGGPGLQHDVYFGKDKDAVANADVDNQNVFCGRQSAETLSYSPNALEYGQTYYWRIDGVNDTDSTIPRKGAVWSFSTWDFVSVQVVDDFESYDDQCNRIYFTWQDGWGHTGGEKIQDCDIVPFEGNGSWAVVGNIVAPYASQTIVYGGSQSLPMDYSNVGSPWFSETQRTWPTPQNWAVNNADALTLYFRGHKENTPDRLYVAIEDRSGHVDVVVHPNPMAVLTEKWHVWHIPLADLEAEKIEVAAIYKLTIGVGDQDNPQPRAAGRLYIDDIQLTNHME